MPIEMHCVAPSAVNALREYPHLSIGEVTTLCGDPDQKGAYRDGPVAGNAHERALLCAPCALTIDPETNALYFIDGGALRCLHDGMVTTVVASEDNGMEWMRVWVDRQGIGCSKRTRKGKEV